MEHLSSQPTNPTLAGLHANHVAYADLAPDKYVALGKGPGATHDTTIGRKNGLDQYYTRPEVAADCYGIFKQHFDPSSFQMVEPSAGRGSFFNLLPTGSLGYDIDPKCAGVQVADFLTIEFETARQIATMGNPPFGSNASTAVRFFNHAALYSNVIAMIFPKTFRKFSIQNRLNSAFHLIRDEEVADDAFTFNSKSFHVPAIFQIWERRDVLRELWPTATIHPDFVFTTPKRANFAIQRVGARAGRVHHNFQASVNSHYFIKGEVEAIMHQIDFAGVAGNVVGNSSLSKAEIVWLYTEWLRRQAKAPAE